VPERQRGRPRSAHAHQAILESARDLLTSSGYEQTTMEAIAAQAGVGKQTVYRRWPSKAAVVAEAVLAGHLAAAPAPPAETGDVAADLRTWLQKQFQRLDDPADAALLRGLAAAAADSDTIAARLYEHLTGPARAQLVHRLAIGVQRGQLRPDADLEAAAEAVLGTLLYRALARRPAYPAADGLLDILLDGMAQPTGACRPQPPDTAPQ
jgi:AcrR family transcriptional regulator